MKCKAAYVNAMGRIVERTFSVDSHDDYIEYTEHFICSPCSKFIFILYADDGSEMEVLSRGCLRIRGI